LQLPNLNVRTAESVTPDPFWAYPAIDFQRALWHGQDRIPDPVLPRRRHDREGDLIVVE
jgi:hypothetical protein